MNLADRQPTGNLSDLRIAARQYVQLQLLGGFYSEASVLFPEPGRLWLAATVDAEQNQRRRATDGNSGITWSCSHDDVSLNQKGPGQGSLDFMGYGSVGSGISGSRADLRP
jgi:hypothetical protein